MQREETESQRDRDTVCLPGRSAVRVLGSGEIRSVSTATRRRPPKDYKCSVTLKIFENLETGILFLGQHFVTTSPVDSCPLRPPPAPPDLLEMKEQMNWTLWRGGGGVKDVQPC